MNEEQIKKGLNIYLYYWTIPIFLAFVIINYLSKNISIEAFDMSLMISVVSFLFGFLVTVTFSMLLTRVSTLKTALSDETGRLVSLYNLSKNLGKEFHDKIKESIDDYTIRTLRDYTNYEVGRGIVYGIYDDVSLMKIKTQNQKAAANSFFYILGELEPAREKLESLTAKRTEWSLKFANYTLGCILIILLFLNRSDTFTNSLFIILSTIVVFIFLIIEDYDSLRIGDYTYNISNSEQLFDLMEKDRYYPEDLLARTKLIHGKTYRIGFVDPITKQEKIFSMVYNPQFKNRLRFITEMFRRKKLKSEKELIA